MRHTYLLLTIIIAFFTAQFICADTVTTEDGSVLNGTIKLIDKGVIHLETSYAGTLKLKQETVVALETTSPLAIRLENGTVTTGLIKDLKGEKLEIKSEEVVVKTRTNEIAAVWAPEKTDPEVERNRRKWKNDFALNLNGRNGNVDRFYFGGNLDMRLKGPKDEISLGLRYEQGEENDNKTADRALGQIGYERFSENKVGWFARNLLEKDPLNGIDLRSTTSSGISYRLINTDVQTLVVRSGLGYRYTEFDDEDRKNESSLTIDTGLFHSYKYEDLFYLENILDYSPATDDFGNYTGVHDSSIKIPITPNENFLIRMGIRNEYESQTSAEEKLDTSYYTQLIYSWK